MSTPQEKLERLKEYNPFVSSSAGDPWEGRYADVPSINRAAFNGIFRLLAHKAKAPLENFGALVLGEVGSGKTHLIGQILEHTKQMHPPVCFAYIQPIEDPTQTYRYLLREIIVNLLQPSMDQSDQQLTQIERLLAEIIKDYLEHGFKPQDPLQYNKVLGLINQDIKLAFRVTINKQDIAETLISYLLGRCPTISRSFLKALFHYRIPARRPLAISWLKGEHIDSEDASALGIPPIDPNTAEAALEKQAITVLESIGLLLSRFRQPMLVCFDRLENLATDEKIGALETMLEFLIDRVPAILPVVFFRGQAWQDRFSKKLNQHVTTRLTTNAFELEDCTTEQALDLIRARLAFAYGVAHVHDLSPFNEETLRKKLGSGFISPRNVITLANRQLADILKDPSPVIDPLDKLQEAFVRQYQAILADFSRYEPDRGRLQCALELYLRHSTGRCGYEIVSLRRGEDKYIDLIAQIRTVGSALSTVAFIIDTHLNHASVNANLTKALRFLEHNKSARAFYIRDPRCPLPAPPRWPVTNATLKRFKDRGGVVLSLDEQGVAGWYALALLHYAVTEGDITTLNKADQAQVISPDEFSHFIGERLHSGRYACFQELDDTLLNKKGAEPASRELKVDYNAQV
jgi:hypothetical protein